MIFKRISFVFLAALFPFMGNAQTTDVYATPGTIDWVVPACVFTVTVQAWGGGGAGGGASATDRNGGGGGGGAFCSFTENVTPGETLRITVGAGGTGVSSGTGNAGGFSQVQHLTGSVIFCRAAGGAGGTKGSSSSTAGVGGAGGQISANIPVNTGFRGGNGGNSDPNTATTDRSGGGGGGAGSGGNGGNGAILTAGAGGAGSGGNGGAGVSTTSSTGALGAAGNNLGGGGGGSTTYNSGTRPGASGARGEIRITYTVGPCCPPPGIPPGITGNTNPCVGATEVYSTSSAGATEFIWELPAGWTITSGANTNTVTVVIGAGGGAVAVSPGNSCDTLSPTILGINLCNAPGADLIFSSPGTYTWVVPACVTSVYVQAWGAGGGGGGIASEGISCGICGYVEACSAGGGGGGGGYTSRSYAVTPGDSYTIVVGAGGTAGPATNSSTSTARDGGIGGNSTFSGPATISLGTLTGLGGNPGRGARTLHTGSLPDHQGNNGLGGTGTSGLNGTVFRTGGNGAVGMHSASCWDLSGGGGGGAGSSTNGGNAATLVCYGSVAGGTGGTSVGGAGGNGSADLGLSTQSFAGNSGISVGGGGGGALIHLRDWLNAWITQPGGVGARGEVRLTYGSCSFLPVTLIGFDGECVGDEKLFTWKTASEENNDYFTLEQSTNGLDFEALAQVDGAGTTNQGRQYSTRVPGNEAYTYYRLTQTDFDGNTRTWNSISVNCDEVLSAFSIYPNPAQNEIFIALDQHLTASQTVVIYDMHGHLVRKETQRPNASNELRINAQGLSAGSYQLEVWSDELMKRVAAGRFTKE
jgi:hypothetical protein